MAQQLIHYLWFRFRPAEGWLPLGLLLGATVSGIITVIEVGWVPEDGVTMVAAFGGLFMSVGLAKRPLNALSAWFFLITYGLVIVTIHLANLWPRLDHLISNPAALIPYWRQNAALFIDRFGSWIKALVSGGSSQETIVFAFGLGLIAWLLAAYAGWSTFRNQKPLLGLTAMGLGVSINMFFGNVPPFWSAIFVGQVGVLTAVLQYSSLELQWQNNGIDFSEELRTELTLYALLISAGLLSISFIIPSIPYTRIAQAFINQPAVQAAEESFETLFGGVAQRGGSRPTPGGVGGTGILPRSYLLGNPPELYEIVMMEAEVLTLDENGSTAPASYQTIQGNHWRGLSYEIYTGEGWALSEERTEPIAEREAIPLPPVQAQQMLFQRIDWQRDNRLTRYTLGLPSQFSDETIAYWRGLDDLVRVRGNAQLYTVISQISIATPEQLHQTAVSDIPPIILARYTALPDSVPERVHDLAQEAVAGADTPYDQARALEQFLRQYPYNLNVELPPSNRDPVDFFLFDLQSGYCDYYASAMVVMARSLGLPARLAVGYLPQRPDESGVQTVYQINGHSWAEVYFAGYGWVEFEPTAAFVSPQDETAVFEIEGSEEPSESSPPPPIPEAAPQRTIPWLRLAVIVGAAASLIVVQLRERQKRQADEIVWTYGRLQTHAQKLGFRAASGNTPYEFETQFNQFLQRYSQNRWLAPTLNRFEKPIRKIIVQFNQHQYAHQAQGDLDIVKTQWARVKWPFWLLRFFNFFRRQTRNGSS